MRNIYLCSSLLTKDKLTQCFYTEEETALIVYFPNLPRGTESGQCCCQYLTVFIKSFCVGEICGGKKLASDPLQFLSSWNKDSFSVETPLKNQVQTQRRDWIVYYLDDISGDSQQKSTARSCCVCNKPVLDCISWFCPGLPGTAMTQQKPRFL